MFINKFCIGSWVCIRILRLTRLWIGLKRSEIYPCWEFLPLNHFEQRRLVSQLIALFVSIWRSMICIQLIFVALISCNLWGESINWSEIVFQSANHCHLIRNLSHDTKTRLEIVLGVLSYEVSLILWFRGSEPINCKKISECFNLVHNWYDWFLSWPNRGLMLVCIPVDRSH